nr:MAG: replication associated protein [Cressdnaviricota sp.]
MNPQESQKSQEKPEGNTKTSGGKNQLYVWCITLKQEDYSASQLSQHLKGFCKKFKFQLEKGETTEYLHWQMVISLKQKEYFATIKNLFPHGAHIEGAKDVFKAYNYCGKSETRVEGPYDENSTFLITIEKLRPWQQDLYNELLTTPHPRKVIWYVDEIGGKGKSAFTKFLAIKLQADCFNNGGTNHIAYALSDQPKICIFDFSRSNEERVNYSVLECVKNGHLFSAKYESKSKIFNTPHLVVFSNFFPERKEMSEDRWDVRVL